MDTSLVLDGELAEHRVRGFTLNPAACDFVRSLPSVACQPLSKAQQRLVDTCAEELHRVRFQPPEGLELNRFVAFGFGRANHDFPDLQRRSILVISPFLDGEFLRSVASRRPRSVLVSRREALLAAPGTHCQASKKFTLFEAAWSWNLKTGTGTWLRWLVSMQKYT